MDDKERWAIIENWENYEVSTFGNIRNKKTGRILRPACKGGYMVVGLCKNSKIKSNFIHRLVASTFIPNINNKQQVNHKDKNRSNNIMSNLEWSTILENNQHRSNGVNQTNNQNIKVWRVDVVTKQNIQLYNSIKSAAEWCFENNYCKNITNARGGISGVIRKIYNKSCGFYWKKEDAIDFKNEMWQNICIEDKLFKNYFVSNLGRFKNSKGIIMTNYKPHNSGYIYVRVNCKKYSLHRLVAFTFLECIESKTNVNHIDGNKLNNAVENLEWVTIQENNSHNYKIGIINSFKRKIIQYDLEMNEIKSFNSIKEATDELKIQTIKKVLYNKQKTAGGFIFKYDN